MKKFRDLKNIPHLRSKQTSFAKIVCLPEGRPPIQNLLAILIIAENGRSSGKMIISRLKLKSVPQLLLPIRTSRLKR